VSEARLLPHLDFDTMLEFSSRGAGVINSRAVELARIHAMPLVILNSLRDAAGTRIDGEVSMERKGIAGVTANEKIVGIHVEHLALEPKAVASFVERLSAIGLDLSGLHQFSDGPGTVGFTFLVPEHLENGQLFRKLDDLVAGSGGRIKRDESAGAVSVVGTGVINTADIAARSMRCLSRAGVCPTSFLSSTLSMTFIVPRAQVGDAVKALHADLVG
jgi:aspartate kinase